MNTSYTSHERVEIYLDAVSGFITDIDPEDRAALRDELRAHLMALVAQYRPSCVFEEDAVEAALRKFGPAYRVGPALDRMTPARRRQRLQQSYYVKRRWMRFMVKGAPYLSMGLVWTMPPFGHSLTATCVYAMIYGIIIGLSEYFEAHKRPATLNARFWRRGFVYCAALLAALTFPHYRDIVVIGLLSCLGRDVVSIWSFIAASRRQHTVH